MFTAKHVYFCIHSDDHYELPRHQCEALLQHCLYASTLSVYIAYIYDKWMNFTYLIKDSKEVLPEVFLGIKLNGL